MYLALLFCFHESQNNQNLKIKRSTCYMLISFKISRTQNAALHWNCPVFEASIECVYQCRWHVLQTLPISFLTINNLLFQDFGTDSAGLKKRIFGRFCVTGRSAVCFAESPNQAQWLWIPAMCYITVAILVPWYVCWVKWFEGTVKEL